MSKQINIGGRIHSTEVGNVSVGANEVLDDTKGKKQNVINSETDAELLRLDQSKQNNLTFDNTPTENSTNPVTSGGVYAANITIHELIEAILVLIPSAASALNQLADKAFVNSSVSTATATFRGTYNVVTDLELAYDASHEQIATKLGQVIATADNNDYAFVQVPVSATSTDIRRTERYKFNGTVWGYEYDLNTSGFTAAQWEAINSAITATLVQKLSALPTAQELAAALLGKQDVLTFDNAPTRGSSNPVKSGGVYTAVNDEKVARENADTGLGNSITAIQNIIPSAASSSNKLVDNAAMTAAINAIINQMDATFNLTTTDGHITLHVTQVDGVITSVQVQSSDIASAANLTLVANDLSALTTRVGTAEGNITSLTGRMTTAEGDIETLQDLYNALQQSAPQVIEPTDPWPVANPSNTVIYRVIDSVNTPPEYYSDYMWNGTSMVLMATYNNAIDTTPKKGSANLITSGGVFANIGAFDVSEYHKSGGTLATYVDLSAALAAVPTDYQKGGMSIKYVQSSDNKYVQYRLMSNEWSTTESDWQGVDDEPAAGSDNLIKSGGVFSKIGGSEINMNKGVIHDTTGSIMPVYAKYIFSPCIKGPFKLTVNSGYYIYNIWKFASEAATTGQERIMGGSTTFPTTFTVTNDGLYRFTIRKTDGTEFNFDSNNICTDIVVSDIKVGLSFEMTKKQDMLISGTNIKTLNGQSVLGNGDLNTQLNSIDITDILIKSGVYALEFTDGAYLSKNTGNPETYASGKYTQDYYKIGHGDFLIDFGIQGNGASVCYYDKNQKFIVDGYDQTVNGEITIPQEAVYVRFSSMNNYLGNISLTPSLKSVNENTESATIKAIRMYPNTKLPVIAFSFDDCVANDEQVVSLFDEYHLTCGFAFIASEQNIANKTARYKGYQNKGFQILSHSVDDTIFNTDNYTVETAKQALNDSLRRIENAGMACNGFVAPSSQFADEFKELPKMFYSYAFTYYDYPHINDREANPCRITRESIQTPSLADVKATIDSYISNDKVLVMYGHAADFVTDGDTTVWSLAKLRAIIEYCIEKRDAGLVYLSGVDDAIKYYFDL